VVEGAAAAAAEGGAGRPAMKWRPSLAQILEQPRLGQPGFSRDEGLGPEHRAF
jgi:hypothetical protein